MKMNFTVRLSPPSSLRIHTYQTPSVRSIRPSSSADLLSPPRLNPVSPFRPLSTPVARPFDSIPALHRPHYSSMLWNLTCRLRKLKKSRGITNCHPDQHRRSGLGTVPLSFLSRPFIDLFAACIKRSFHQPIHRKGRYKEGRWKDRGAALADGCLPRHEFFIFAPRSASARIFAYLPHLS
jgi:hypothetical protein